MAWKHLINFALLLLQPRLTKDAANKISKSYSELRDQENVGNETAKVIYLRLCYFVINNFGYKRFKLTLSSFPCRAVFHSFAFENVQLL